MALKVLSLLVRGLAWLAGSVMVISSVADVLGYVPYSYETPPWTQRLLSNLPVIASGLVLLAPMRWFLRGLRFRLLMAAYGVLVATQAWASLRDGLAYLEGHKSWQIVPAALVFLAVPAANALLLWWRHRGAVRASA